MRTRGELPAGPQDPFSSEKSISTGVGKPSMGHRFCRRFCRRDFVAKFPLRPELTAGPQDPPFSLKSFPYAPIVVQILPLRAHFRQNAHIFVKILPLRAISSHTIFENGRNPSLTRTFLVDCRATSTARSKIPYI